MFPEYFDIILLYICSIIAVIQFELRVSYVCCSSGLSDSEAMKLDNYLHFSEPKNLKKRSILEKGDLNPAIDFLDVLTDDIPKGESTELSYVSSHINKCHILQDLLQLLKQPNSQCKRSHCTFLQTTDKFNVFMLELRFFCPNPKESNGVVTKSYPNLIGVPFFHI